MFVGENMVKEYLEKIKEQFLEQKIEVSKRVNELSNKYKENVEFIKLLEETNDPNFESFTPREVNGFNRTKIAELEKMQKILKSANKGSFSSWLNRYGKRVACIALVFLVASFVAVLSVDAWRTRLFWFVFSEYR